MAMVLAFEEKVIRAICAYAPQVGRSECEKDQFYDDMVSGICKALVKWFLVWGTSTDMLGDGLMVLRMYTKLAKEMLRKEDYSGFVIKRSCAWQIHGLKRKSRKK